MALPFDTVFYDTLYLSISSVLREKFPQGAEEDLLSWHRRLLYEFVSYLQATYEPDTTAVKVPANQKNNKKKDNPGQANFAPVDQPLFNANVEQALDIVSQDSDFAIYLIAWWLPILISPTDTVTICVDLDCSSTLAASVKLTRLEMEFSWWTFRLLSINNIAPLAPKTNDAQTLEDCAGDPFVRGVLHALYKSANGGEKPPASLTIADVRESATISLNSAVDPFANAAQIATILWKLKNIVEPLFIAGLTLKSNLITEDLMVSKASEDKSQRKRFNSRKFIETAQATPQEMSVGVLQTLAISTFRTFYDYDADTIDPALFDYLFLNTHNLTL